jgi:hypothetical protein
MAPLTRDEYGLCVVRGHYRADLTGVKSLEQRRDNAFGFSRERIGAGHQGFLLRVD